MLKIILVILFLIFISLKVEAQIKYDFDSVFIQINKPPANCREASILFPLDSVSGKVVAGTEFYEQEIKLKKIQTEINTSLSNFKKQQKDMPKPPPGSGPPGGFPSINPEDFSDMQEITEKRAKAFENITISMNQFKNEILGNQEELNNNLKKTKLPEEDLRLKYVNEFLENSEEEFVKCLNIVSKNVSALEQTYKDEKSSSKKNFPMAKIGLLKYQSELINSALLLFNISKQLSETGSMFFYGIK